MREEIKKEIEELSPLIAEIGNKRGFKVPDGYFDELSSKMTSKTVDFDSNGLPSGYFDKMQEEVLVKMHREEAATTKIISLRKIISVAAIFIGIGFVGILVFLQLNDSMNVNDNSLAFNDIDNASLVEYLDGQNALDYSEMVDDELLDFVNSNPYFEENIDDELIDIIDEIDLDDLDLM